MFRTGLCNPEDEAQNPSTSFSSCHLLLITIIRMVLITQHYHAVIHRKGKSATEKRCQGMINPGLHNNTLNCARAHRCTVSPVGVEHVDLCWAVFLSLKESKFDFSQMRSSKRTYHLLEVVFAAPYVSLIPTACPFTSIIPSQGPSMPN